MTEHHSTGLDVCAVLSAAVGSIVRLAFRADLDGAALAAVVEAQTLPIFAAAFRPAQLSSVETVYEKRERPDSFVADLRAAGAKVWAVASARTLRRRKREARATRADSSVHHVASEPESSHAKNCNVEIGRAHV